MLTCYDVANYLLSLTNEEVGDLVSNLKLQKLVYYAQGFYLALFNEPLFSESIEAWAHGPVVPGLYHKYKKYGSGVIPCPKNINFAIYNESVKELLNEVYDVYGQFSAWKLRNMTYEEPPWIDAYETPAKIIPQNSMEKYFKTLLVD